MANIIRSRQARGGSRRATSWTFGPTQVPADLSAAGAAVWPLATGTIEDGTTLIRTRGVFSAVLTAVGTIGDGFTNAAIGIGITTEEAFVVGGTPSVPHPLADDDWEGWIYHKIIGAFRGSSTTPLGRSPMEAVRFDIDSKAMRKWEDGMVIFGITEVATEVGVATLQVQGDTRILVKLP